MSDRIPLDDLTSDQLDQLYERADAYRAAWKSACDRARKNRRLANQAEDLLRVAHETSNRSEAERARAAATIERVRQLHQPAPGGSGGLSFNSGARCAACDHPYRCDTIRTLDQAQQPTTTETS